MEELELEKEKLNKVANNHTLHRKRMEGVLYLEQLFFFLPMQVTSFEDPQATIKRRPARSKRSKEDEDALAATLPSEGISAKGKPPELADTLVAGQMRTSTSAESVSARTRSIPNSPKIPDLKNPEPRSSRKETDSETLDRRKRNFEEAKADSQRATRSEAPTLLTVVGEITGHFLNIGALRAYTEYLAQALEKKTPPQEIQLPSGKTFAAIEWNKSMIEPLLGYLRTHLSEIAEVQSLRGKIAEAEGEKAERDLVSLTEKQRAAEERIANLELEITQLQSESKTSTLGRLMSLMGLNARAKNEKRIQDLKQEIATLKQEVKRVSRQRERMAQELHPEYIKSNAQAVREMLRDAGSNLVPGIEGSAERNQRMIREREGRLHPTEFTNLKAFNSSLGEETIDEEEGPSTIVEAGPPTLVESQRGLELQKQRAEELLPNGQANDIWQDIVRRMEGVTAESEEGARAHYGFTATDYVLKCADVAEAALELRNVDKKDKASIAEAEAYYDQVLKELKAWNKALGLPANGGPYLQPSGASRLMETKAIGRTSRAKTALETEVSRASGLKAPESRIRENRTTNSAEVEGPMKPEKVFANVSLEEAQRTVPGAKELWDVTTNALTKLGGGKESIALRQTLDSFQPSRDNVATKFIFEIARLHRARHGGANEETITMIRKRLLDAAKKLGIDRSPEFLRALG